MTAEMNVVDWLPFLEREYLDEFIRDGGASVKFVVPHDQQGKRAIIEGLEASAIERGYRIASASAGDTKIHLMDQLFFRVAEQIPWEQLARSVVESLARSDNYLVPEPSELPFIEALARANDLDEAFLSMELRKRVSSAVFKRRNLAKDFRVAMSQLCLAQIAGGSDGATTSAAIVDWLTGQIKTVGAIKPYNIFTRINRTNARYFFESLLDWIQYSGFAGLVVSLDASRLTVARNPRDGQIFYSKAGRLDAYELLRQFVDATDRMSGLLFVIIPDIEFLDESPSSKGVGEYQALYFRVFDEIRDRELVNPMGSLIRISAISTKVPTYDS